MRVEAVANALGGAVVRATAATSAMGDVETAKNCEPSGRGCEHEGAPSKNGGRTPPNARQGAAPEPPGLRSPASNASGAQPDSRRPPEGAPSCSQRRGRYL